MSQQQCTNDVSVDEILIGISNPRSDKIKSTEIPAEIRSNTRGLTSEQPPTNSLVALKAARWWYIHGKGGTDPAFQWARHLATDTPTEETESTGDRMDGESELDGV